MSPNATALTLLQPCWSQPEPWGRTRPWHGDRAPRSVNLCPDGTTQAGRPSTEPWELNPRLGGRVQPAAVRRRARRRQRTGCADLPPNMST
ncbi:hypothetical protein LX36DRAFT_650829 [Colletotrichum falcatum]|nr:hypothetical protein LX36DRAFT_650829 [Colletotrichum falcatum]